MIPETIPAKGPLQQETQSIRRVLGDLTAISTLSAIWARGEPPEIADSLAHVLCRSLQLDLVYVRIKDCTGRTAVEVARTCEGALDAAQVQEIGRQLDPLVHRYSNNGPPTIDHPFAHGRLRLAVAMIGVGGESGLLVAGSSAPDFPAEHSKLLLGTAANQAAVALQNWQAQQTQNWNARRHALLSQTAARLLECADPQAVVEDLCRDVLEFLDCDTFFNYLLDERAGRLRLNACGGIPQEEARRIEWLDRGQAVCGCVARDGKRIIAQDIQGSGDPRTELVKSYGTQAYCCHPMMIQGQLIGTLSFGTRSRAQFTNEEIEVMRAVSDLVAIAMHRVATEQAVQRSQQDLINFFESASIGLHWVGPDGTILRVNQAELDMLGYSREEYLGRHIADFHVDRRVIEDILSRLAQGETLREYPARMRCKNGSIRDVLINSSVLFENGQFVHTRCFTHDITDRLRAEEAERASKGRYQQTLSLMPTAVYSCDATGLITYYNERAAQLWGRAPRMGDTDERFCGSEQMILPDGTPLAHHQCPMAVALREGRSFREAEVNIRRPDGSIVPVLVNIDPIRNEQGEVIGAINAFQDITTIKQAEKALRENERRFREMIDALPAAIYTTDARGRLTHFNPACIEFSGRVPELGSDEWCVTWKLYHPDGTPMPHDRCPMAVALKEGRVVRGAEAIAERPDGTRIWFTPYPTPLRDAEGRITGGINMLVDITQRKLAEEAKGRLAAIVESSEDAILSKNVHGIITSWNRGAERTFGYTAEEMIGQPVTTLMPADRLSEEVGILERIRRGEKIDQYETTRRRKDGTLLDVSLAISPLLDACGRVIGASKIIRDITERKRAENRMRMVMGELNHRVKNTLATVEAVARQTLHTAGSMEDFVRSFGARLRSMAAAHSLLTRTEWIGAELSDILDAELAARISSADHLTLGGPRLVFEPKSALALHMAIHELATNAAKYGALSVPSGHLLVEWNIIGGDENGSVVIRWEEKDGPAVQEPRKQGFGSQMINQLIEYELDGKVECFFERDGFSCHLSIPLTSTVDTNRGGNPG